jgi:hypothetical protein
MVGEIYQTSTRQWPIAAARPIEYRLAGRLVTKAMADDSLAAKRAGLRVMITTPGISAFDESHDTEMCANCGGLGRMYLQTLIGGPFKTPPSITPGGDERAGFHNGEWYKMTLKGYSCPVCRKEVLP